MKLKGFWERKKAQDQKIKHDTFYYTSSSIYSYITYHIYFSYGIQKVNTWMLTSSFYFYMILFLTIFFVSHLIIYIILSLFSYLNESKYPKIIFLFFVFNVYILMIFSYWKKRLIRYLRQKKIYLFLYVSMMNGIGW